VEPTESDVDVVEEMIEQTRVESISDRDEFLKVVRPFGIGKAESVSLDGGSGGSRPLPLKDPLWHGVASSGPMSSSPRHRPRCGHYRPVMPKPAGTSKAPTRIASIEQVADFAGCSQRSIRRDINEGRLRGYRFGRRLVLAELDRVEELLQPIPTIGTI